MCQVIYRYWILYSRIDCFFIVELERQNKNNSSGIELVCETAIIIGDSNKKNYQPLHVKTGSSYIEDFNA